MLTGLILAAVEGGTELAESASELQVESLIRDLAFILILGAAVTVLFKWIRQPVVLGYIVAGFLASPHFEYLPSVTTESNIDFWAQIGIVVLLFSLGLEFSFKKLLNVGGSAVVTALIIVTGMMAAGFAIGHVLGFSRINSLFLGGMLSMSSTTIIIKAFTDLGLRQRKFASLVFAVLIVEDLFAVLMMVILSSIAVNSSVAGGEMLFSISKLAFFLIIWFVVGVYVLPSVLNACRRFLSDETLLIVAMGLCLGMAVFSVTCGFSLALGAFVMGSILAGTSYAERIEHVTAPVKDLFGSVFFISVGMMVNPGIIIEYWSPILILSAVVIVGMIVFGTFGMLVTGQSLRIAIGIRILTHTDRRIRLHHSLARHGPRSPSADHLPDRGRGVGDHHFHHSLLHTHGRSVQQLRRVAPARKVAFPDRPLFPAGFDRKRDAPAVGVGAATLYLACSPLLHSTHSHIADIARHSTAVARRPMAAMGSPGRMHGHAHGHGSVPARPQLSGLETHRTRAPHPANARFDVPLIVMTLFRLVISLGFIIYVMSSIYSIAIGSTIGLAIFVLGVMFLSKRVRRRLSHIETKFLNNLNERELRRSGKNNNIISDMHLAYMDVGYGCPFVGERLDASDLRKNYGINVVSIQRGSRFIPVPEGRERIFPGDTIGVIGTDDQIRALLPVVEPADDGADESNDRQREVKLTHVQLTASSPLIGKTLASADIRNTYHSLVVALQRDDEFISLARQPEFAEGDKLWVVGEAEQIDRIVKG